jgi:hypothetical protein
MSPALRGATVRQLLSHPSQIWQNYKRWKKFGEPPRAALRRARQGAEPPPRPRRHAPTQSRG